MEPIADGSGHWVKVRDSETFPNGKAAKLPTWRSMTDAESLEALDLTLGSWGLHRTGSLHKGDDGRLYVTIVEHG
ncbi:hypothetical protein [Microbacterium sp. NPDC077486]|uniref:hypothetical protein n=1 Tax=Microbacterium sp. NPDC077486 TaxID=3154766 RepID=UPI003416A48D